MFLAFLENDTALHLSGRAKALSHHDTAFWRCVSGRKQKNVLKMPKKVFPSDPLAFKKHSRLLHTQVSGIHCLTKSYKTKPCPSTETQLVRGN